MTRMAHPDTDYLIVGAGATGLAFADTLLQQSDAHITLVDQGALPGGHWNDAYPFVTLHQPSAFYGVASMELGEGRLDTVGPNAGMYELASGAEVSGYFQRVMHQRLLPSGRVRYLPMSRFNGMDAGVASVTSSLTGVETRITVRKKRVDSTLLSPDVPATSPPRFDIAPGVRWVTPTGLTQLGHDANGPGHPSAYCVVGAGKTAMDVVLWLLHCGVQPEAIHWVMPRDSWVVNRLHTQPGETFFSYSVGGEAALMRSLAQASSARDLFARLEAVGQMLRIDTAHEPTMFHYATLSEGEVALLRQVRQVVRMGRVRAIMAEHLVLEQGSHAMPRDTLYVHCSASAVRWKPPQPVFQPGLLVVQLLRAPLITFSASVCAYVEAHHADDAAKNALCAPVPFPSQPAGYIPAVLVSMGNHMRWSQDKALRGWIRDNRLDGFGRLVSQIAPDDTEKQAIVAELRQHIPVAFANGQRLMAQQPPAAASTAV